MAEWQVSDQNPQYDEYDCPYDECWYEYGIEEPVATAESLDNRDEGEVGCDEELECWVEAEMDEMITASEQQDEQIAGYEAGELGSDEELECWIDAEIDQMTTASQQRAKEVVSRNAILSLARTLDRMSATLQAISRHLTEMAAPEVAEVQVWIDEPVLR
jgi:hypothetical protein